MARENGSVGPAVGVSVGSGAVSVGGAGCEATGEAEAVPVAGSGDGTILVCVQADTIININAAAPGWNLCCFIFPVFAACVNQASTEQARI